MVSGKWMVVLSQVHSPQLRSGAEGLFLAHAWEQ